jgi:protein-serine/threonine kinase
MTVLETPETSQADGEGPDSSDIPPHDDLTPRPNKAFHKQTSNGLVLDSFKTALKMTETTSIPLPSPEAGAYPKEPGNTRCALEKLILAAAPPHDKHSSSSTLDSAPSSVIESSSPSDSECTSAPSSKPPSQVSSRTQSRAPSLSGDKVTPSPAKAAPKKMPSSAPPTPMIPYSEPSSATTVRPRAPSVASTDGSSHKFNLKDLLSNGPKLVRKSSGRSIGSSKKSDSDDTKSNAGSTASLSKKYGVCQKLAIGKGATSVVRLAHKWDRSEEKLYAVKVSPVSFI